MNILEIEAMNDWPEEVVLSNLQGLITFDEQQRLTIVERAAALVQKIRSEEKTGLMESFLAEYGLSSEEGIALMCLAEALLRVPDAETMDVLIEDKIAPSDWGAHLGQSSSSLVNASTWALLITGRVLEDEQPGMAGVLRGALKRLGEPIIRKAVLQAMKEMGRQFVLGETIESGISRARKMESKGYSYSYDMLGEAACTEVDAERYFSAYAEAIRQISHAAKSDDIRKNPGISVKLSALHPRYELLKRGDVLEELSSRLFELALLAKAGGIGLNIDAEESERLYLSLEIIERVLARKELASWDGFGVVVQAYGKRAMKVIDWLYALAKKHDRKIMVRLVKGAYWDREIKRAQQLGLEEFPVFTAKAATDISYIANAQKLLGMTDHIYPQFATHNAHTVASILEMGADRDEFEFQRLHGMGEALHDIVLRENKTACRIYAPVGAHEDLLAYLVRRLLENGANSSFVNQIVDLDIPAEEVVEDPLLTIEAGYPPILKGKDIFEPERANSKGFDIWDVRCLDKINEDRLKFRSCQWRAAPLIAGICAERPLKPVYSPANLKDKLGEVRFASEAEVKIAHQDARIWDAPQEERRMVLENAAKILEENYAEIFALLTREAGKTLNDAVAELREAVDFLYYYSKHAQGDRPRGTIVCISPWNFPLAIFLGQIAAALSEGNAVLAKPAEQSTLIAYRAVEWLHEAGVPMTALQLLPGLGAEIGATIVEAPTVRGVCFTGSTGTALKIRENMAQNLEAGTPFIAETGGINAMIVDSTALKEQAVRAIMESAFQSAGQRCSALRCLYVQNDVADELLEMLKGAMKVFELGDPWENYVDCGPVIDHAAQKVILDHIEEAKNEGRLIFQGECPDEGIFVPLTLIELNGIAGLEREIFGPVLHVVRFEAEELPGILEAINETKYGLTFGLQTRIDGRVQEIIDALHVGNIYVNRNQIGAIVGSQPFGGEGLSGTGPKAGGPFYLSRFREIAVQIGVDEWGDQQDISSLEQALSKEAPKEVVEARTMPGPTGESNRWVTLPRGNILCMGPAAEMAKAQADAVTALGGYAVQLDGAIEADELRTLENISAAIWWGDEASAREFEIALSQRKGSIVALIRSLPDQAHVLHERHVCVDTTASGGNTELLAIESVAGKDFE